MNTLKNISEEEQAFAQTYAPGTVVEVEIKQIIKPSQVITSFTADFIGRLSLLDIALNMPEAEQVFHSYKIGDKIKCAIWEIDLQNKVVLLNQKVLIPERIGWDKLNREIKISFKLIQRLNFYSLLQSEEGFFGLVPNEVEFEENDVFLVKDKLDDSGLLSLVPESSSGKLSVPVHAKQTSYRLIDEDFRDYNKFSESILFNYATEEDVILIQSGFDLDPLIFSKDIRLKQPLFLEFDRSDLSYSTYLKSVAFPHFFPDQTFTEQGEKNLLDKLASMKYWFKLNYREEVSKTDPEAIVELIDFTLFNEDLNIYVNVQKSKNSEPRLVVKSLNIGHDRAATTVRKRKFSKDGAFLFSSDIILLSPYMTTPIGLVQSESIAYLELKTNCRTVAERLKTASGEILRQEGKTLAIIDRFLEFQLNLQSQSEDEIFVKGFKRVPGESEGITIQLSDNIEIDLENDSLVVVKVMRESLKENQDEELSRVTDAKYKNVNGVRYLTFFGSIELANLRAGFYLEKKVSKKNLSIQRDIIKDFLGKKIKLDHIESLLIKPDRIKAPNIDKINFNNPDLRSTEVEFPDNNQVMAVKKAVGNKNIFLIQGPPGTGKTTVIAEIIEQLVSRGKKVLVAGQNHVAVDNVLQKMRKNTGLNLLRAGRTDRVAPDLVRFCVDNLIEEYKADFKNFIKNQSALCSAFIDLQKQKLSREDIINEYRIYVDKMCSGYGALSEWYRQKHLNLRDGLIDLNLTNIEKASFVLDNWIQNIQTEYEHLLKPYLFNSVDVVFATCIGIRMDSAFKERKTKFDTVIIDEAGKASIAETLVAMELGKKVILVGDQMQLPPYMDSTLLDSNNPSSFLKSPYVGKYMKEEVYDALKTSFFEFIINRIKEGQFPTENLELLNYQHRMHPNIGEFVSSSFYEGRVQMGRMTPLNRLDLPVPFDKEIVFFDTSNSINPFEISEGLSIRNDHEAKSIAEEILPALIDNHVSPSEIAIIAPYKAQVSNIIKFLKESSGSPVEQIDISTLDSFQGKEYDIIIFSFTRSANNSNHTYKEGKVKYTKVGFLDDARRLNVAFSRARKKLVLIGNSKYLGDPKSHFDSGLFNYTRLFQKLIKISKNPEIGRFVNTTDSLRKRKKKTKPLMDGMWVMGIVRSSGVNENGYEYGKFIETANGCILAPFKDAKKDINKILKSSKIGDKIEGIVVESDFNKKLIFLVLHDSWRETKKKHETKEPIKVKVLEMNWMGLKVHAENGIKGTVKMTAFKEKDLPSKDTIIDVTVESYDYKTQTIEFKPIS